MASYSYPLFLHIIGVVGLFVAIGLQTASLVGIIHAHTAEQVRVWCGSHKVLIRIFIVSFLLTLLPGMHLTFNTWGWTTAWINASVVALLVLSGLGPLINTRRLKAIHKAALTTPDGPIPNALARQSRDPLLWSSILGMNGLAIGIIYLMVLKPDLLGSIMALCISTLLGVGIAWFVWRPRPASTPLPSVN